MLNVQKQKKFFWYLSSVLKNWDFLDGVKFYEAHREHIEIRKKCNWNIAFILILCKCVIVLRILMFFCQEIGKKLQISSAA